METVTISSKFQVVIPKGIRNRLGIKSGQKFQVFNFGDRIEFIPIKPIKTMRGFLKDMGSNINREKKDRY
jgi:AbrB family looped-hinge helix DNA binding protein